MRDGLSLLDQVYSFSQDKIDETSVRSALGIISNEIYDTVVSAIAVKNPVPALSAVDDILTKGFDLQEFTGGLLDYVRTMLFSRIPDALDNPRIDRADGAIETIAAHASAFSEATLLRMAEIIRKTENELKWSTFPRFLVELMLLKLVHMDETVSIETLLNALEGAQPADAAPVAEDKKKNEPDRLAVSLVEPRRQESAAPKRHPVAEETPSAKAPPAGEQKSLLSLDDEIAHEPIIRNVLDIFDGTPI
jgi:DNA polymerase-3 subunit gamma/tau